MHHRSNRTPIYTFSHVAIKNQHHKQRDNDIIIITIMNDHTDVCARGRAHTRRSSSRHCVATRCCCRQDTHTHARACKNAVFLAQECQCQSHTRAQSLTLFAHLPQPPSPPQTPYYIYYANFRKISDKNALGNLWLAGAGGFRA